MDQQTARPGFLSGGGNMGALIRAFDWPTTPIGAPPNWPHPLKILVGVMLAAGHPMFIAWGPERVLLYNDDYAPMLAERHPAALGRPFFDVWPEFKDELTPWFSQVFAGEPAHTNDIALILDRGDGRREVHFAFSYTPVADDAGRILGLLSLCTETTEQLLAARQLAGERDQFAQLFEQAPTFMAMLRGPDHRIELANPGYMQLVGHRPVLGRTVGEALPDAVEQGYLDLLDRVFASGEAFAANAAPNTPSRPGRAPPSPNASSISSTSPSRTRPAK
ncbi:MAG: PAS domain-containing protein [Acetobacteraceae bacterium]